MVLFLTLLCRVGVVGLMALYALPAGAGWEAANAAYRKGDFVTAMKELRPLAERGDVNAQYNVGVMHGQGDGVGRDESEAVKWFLGAAQQGHAGAQMNLGIIFSRDGGVHRDEAVAAALVPQSRRAGSDRCPIQPRRDVRGGTGYSSK